MTLTCLRDGKIDRLKNATVLSLWKNVSRLCKWCPCLKKFIYYIAFSYLRFLFTKVIQIFCTLTDEILKTTDLEWQDKPYMHNAFKSFQMPRHFSFIWPRSPHILKVPATSLISNYYPWSVLTLLVAMARPLINWNLHGNPSYLSWVRRSTK